MLPDLGKYVVPVLSAYGAMIILAGGLVLASLKSAKDSKKTLAKLEQKRKAKSND
ncbi:MAG: heme exporter protein CcmD [Rhodobacteraceae bacterium]|nr:heme exporter protein CcmD [Paracoccaceae bacterium]